MLKKSAIQFTNPFDDYVGKWDGEEFSFPKGESIYIQHYLACHFAKHLVNRELHKAKLQTSDPKKHELLKMISPRLKWSNEKHFVIALGEVKKSSVKEDLETLKAYKVSDPATEIQPPMKENEPKVAESEKQITVGVPSRKELNAEAFALGIGKTKVLKAPNKAAVIELIKAAKGN